MFLHIDLARNRWYHSGNQNLRLSIYAALHLKERPRLHQLLKGCNLHLPMSGFFLRTKKIFSPFRAFYVPRPSFKTKKNLGSSIMKIPEINCNVGAEWFKVPVDNEKET